MDELKHIGARIPGEIADELEKIAKEQGLKFSDILRDALKSYVEAVRSHRCPECGEINDPDHNFCKKCGHALKIEDQEEIERIIEKIKSDPIKQRELLKLLKS